MSELFELPESLSPRMAWMRKHGITTSYDPSELEADAWLAYHKDSMTTIFALDEESALIALAMELGIKDWRAQ